MMVLKDKLISFPEEILDKLEEYRQKTGIPATDYIRDCVCRKMIIDGLIFIKTRYIFIEKEENGKKLLPNTPPEEIKFCDGDKCEIDPRELVRC